MNIQDLLETYDYARVQAGFNEEQFLDQTQMHSKHWFGGEGHTEGAISACKDFEALMEYISKAGHPDHYDTIVIFDAETTEHEAEDAEIGEVLVVPTAVKTVIKIEDIEGYDEYLDELLGF